MTVAAAVRTGAVLALATVTLTLVPPPAFGHGHEPPPPAVATAETEPGRGPHTTPIVFELVGFELPDGVDAVEVRVRTVDGTWSDWTLAEGMDPGEDGPDRDEGGEVAGFTDPIWTGAADALEVRGEGAEGVVAHLVDASGHGERWWTRLARHLTPTAPAAEAQADTSAPHIVSRAGWGADESITRSSSTTATVRHAVVHHTATSNSYSRGDVPAIMRSMHSYHTRTLGWADLGYNLVIDRFGRAYEGRRGGLTRAVVGAHAQGFNRESFGVAVIGTYETVSLPSEAERTLAEVIGWKFALHGVDPSRTVTVTSGGSNRWPSGTVLRLDPIVGHNELGRTACPGARFIARLPALRQAVAGQTAVWAAPAWRFADVAPTSFAHDQIVALADLGVLTGGTDGRFRPAAALTRAQMIATLHRLSGSPEASAPHGFSDVGPEAVHGRAIDWAAETALVSGYADGRLDPGAPISRGHLVALLYRLAGSPEPATPHAFVDVRNPTYDDAVAWAVERGITVGTAPDRFDPTAPVTRAQTAVMLHRVVSTPVADELGVVVR